MPRVYPPIWCKGHKCEECNFLDCDSRILKLFAQHKYKNLDFVNRPQQIEITSIAIYFGYCQRLAKFFLSFPQHSPMPVVENNFVNAATGLPTKVEIQRIMLDMLDHGDPNAPTDETHRLRLMFIMRATNNLSGFISSEKGDIEIKLTEKELADFTTTVNNWLAKFFNQNLSYEKTEKLDRCKYCFLPNCENI
jgi:hypothetical protein